MPRIKKSILEDKSLSLKEKFLKGLPQKATYLRALVLRQRSLLGDDLNKHEQEWRGRYSNSRLNLIGDWCELGGYVRRLPNGFLVLEEGPVPKDARQGTPAPGLPVWEDMGVWNLMPVWEHMGELDSALIYQARKRSAEQQALLELANQLAKEKLERKAKRKPGSKRSPLGKRAKESLGERSWTAREAPAEEWGREPSA